MRALCRRREEFRVIDIFLAGGRGVVTGGNVAGWDGSRRSAFDGAGVRNIPVSVSEDAN